MSFKKAVCYALPRIIYPIAFPKYFLYRVGLGSNCIKNWYTRIDDYVILGALPHPYVVKRVTEELNVKAVITMNEAWELKFIRYPQAFLDSGVDSCNMLHCPIQDLSKCPSSDEITKCLTFICRYFEDECNDGTVYVHCKAGKTRSATIVVCYLMLKHNLMPEQAIARVRSLRPCIHLPKFCLEGIRNYHRHFIQPYHEERKRRKATSCMAI